jgi:hypothetical protein
MAIGIQTGLKLCQALRQLDQEPALSRDLVDQEAGPSIAERDLGDIDPILEQVERR